MSDHESMKGTHQGPSGQQNDEGDSETLSMQQMAMELRQLLNTHKVRLLDRGTEENREIEGSRPQPRSAGSGQAATNKEATSESISNEEVGETVKPCDDDSAKIEQYEQQDIEKDTTLTELQLLYNLIYLTQQGEKSQLHARLEKLAAANTDLTEQLEILKAENKKLLDDKVRWDDKMQKRAARDTALMGEFGSLMTRNEKLLLDNSKFHNFNGQLRAEREKLRDEVETLTIEKEEMSRDLENLEVFEAKWRYAERELNTAQLARIETFINSGYAPCEYDPLSARFDPTKTG